MRTGGQPDYRDDYLDIIPRSCSCSSCASLIPAGSQECTWRGRCLGEGPDTTCTEFMSGPRAGMNPTSREEYARKFFGFLAFWRFGGMTVSKEDDSVVGWCLEKKNKHDHAIIAQSSVLARDLSRSARKIRHLGTLPSNHRTFIGWPNHEGIVREQESEYSHFT